MDANTQNISEATIALIDSLKSTTSHFGLANSGGEYKIITEMFLYKYFNDKFGYEAKRDKIYGERLSKADKWDAEYDKFTEEEVTFTTFQIKIADMMPAELPTGRYEMYWIRTFVSEEEAVQFAEDQIAANK